MPDEARPDRCGVIFSLETSSAPRDIFEQAYFIGRAIHSAADIEHPVAQAGFAMLIDAAVLPVYVGVGSLKSVVFPREEVGRYLLTGDEPPPHLAAEVRNWRDKLS